MRFEIAVSPPPGRGSEVRIASDAAITALIGPSGIGKTTVLKMVAGLVRPASGRIAIGGRVLFDAAARIDLAPEQRRCGFVFQDDRLFPHLSVRRNLTYGQRLAPPEARWADLDAVCELLGLATLLDRKPGTLSGGEARRVAIGRALLAAPQALLMDEPLNSLDTARREVMLAAIEGIRDRFALPILYVSHQPDEVARLAGAVVELG